MLRDEPNCIPDQEGTEEQVKRYISLLKLPEELKKEISTRKGPAKVQSISLLAETLKDKAEMLTAIEKIAGFTQQVRLESYKATRRSP